MTGDLLSALQANSRILREIGLRYGVASRGDLPYADDVGSPEGVAAHNADMLQLLQEQLRVMILNTKGRLLDTLTVYQGTVNEASTRVAEIIRPAIVANAPQIIIVHNHPSGDSEPSGSDIAVTRKVYAACKVHDITLLDHVIVADGALPFSMKRRGIVLDGVTL